MTYLYKKIPLKQKPIKKILKTPVRIIYLAKAI